MNLLGKINYYLLQPIIESSGNDTTVGQIKAIYDAFNAKLLLYFVYDNKMNKNLFNELQKICPTSNIQYEEGREFWSNYLNQFFSQYLGSNVLVLVHQPLPNILDKQFIILKHVGDAFYIKDGVFYCQEHNYSLFCEIKNIIQYNGLIYHCSSYYVPNGDIIETEDFVLLGRYSIKNGNNPDFFQQELIKRRNWEKKHIILLGPENTGGNFYSAKTFYHLDLHLMYLGKVGCCKHTFLLGQLEYNETVHTGKNDKETIRQLNATLNKIATNLAEINDAKIIRVLLPYTNSGVHTFLNGVVENFGGNLKIYVPTYTMANQQIQTYHDDLYSQFINTVSNMDATVVKTADYSNQVFSYGALHCTMNVISRSPC